VRVGGCSSHRMVLISRARGNERTATAVRSSPRMSVQPDIPLFVSGPPPLPDGGFFGSCRGLTSVCSFFVSRRGWTSCVSSSYTLFPPPPSPTKARWSLSAPCAESGSHWDFNPRPTRPEPAATAVRSSLRMSCQPDIPICVSAPPPSSAKARRLLRSCRG